jgi:hypothetical protein
MTTYYFELKQCPACKIEFSCMQVGSCNTFGAKFYTDGYVDGPMYDETTVVAPCPNCEHVLWFEDLPTIKHSNAPFRYGESDDGHIFEVSRFKAEQFKNLLSGENWGNEEQEKYVRMRAWWAANHRYRKLGDDEFTVVEEQRINLKRLLILLGDYDTNDMIMRAEIFRQLGIFEECLTILDTCMDKGHPVVLDTIRGLANDRCIAVQQIVFED